jgi:hypothetical protein
MYCCDPWCLTTRKVRGSDWERGADRMCGPKRNEIPGEWRKLNGEGSLVGTRNTITIHNTSYDFNPLPVQFKSLLPGQEGRVFFSGHLNIRKYHYVLLRLGRQEAFKSTTL